MKIVVIDDDPTGSQTVHGCPLLLRWDSEALEAGLRHPSPLLFILANTRALAPEAAAARVREICAALRRPRAALGLEDWLVVSRGDSTLRGHFPLEVEVMAAELGPFDATLLVPAFLEGGRTTVAGGASGEGGGSPSDGIRQGSSVRLSQQFPAGLGGGEKRWSDSSKRRGADLPGGAGGRFQQQGDERVSGPIGSWWKGWEGSRAIPWWWWMPNGRSTSPPWARP